MSDFKSIPHFRFWCQKVLPLTYDNSLSYMELLCKVINYLNHVIDDVNQIPDYIKDYVSEEKLRPILSDLLNEIREQIARANEGTNTTASFDRDVDELVWLNGKLIRMTRNILAGDRYVEEVDPNDDITGNFVYTSVEIEMQRIKDELRTDFNNLTTALNNEISARETADANLQSYITQGLNNEQESRVNADNQMQANIDSEASTRASADNQLQANIDIVQSNVNSEAATRYEQDQYILGLLQLTNVGSYSNIVTVGAHGCNYLTINDAITTVKTYATPNNRVAIVVLSGTYNEEVILTNNPGIDLYGIGMPVIRYGSTYPNAPIFCDGKITIDGFYLHNNKNDGNAYGLHYEGQSDGTVGSDVLIRNCTIVSDANSAVGYGSGNSGTARFENCYFVTNNSSVSPMYLHNRPQGSDYVQSIEVINCEMRSAGDFALLVDNARALQSVSATSLLRLTFMNCSGGAGHWKVNYRNAPNSFQWYVPNSGEVYVSENSINNDIKGITYDEQKFTLRHTESLPMYFESNYGTATLDFITPFDARIYYRKIDSAICNGVDITNLFTIDSTGINKNTVPVYMADSTYAGRNVQITMSFSMDSNFA